MDVDVILSSGAVTVWHEATDIMTLSRSTGHGCRSGRDGSESSRRAGHQGSYPPGAKLGPIGGRSDRFGPGAGGPSALGEQKITRVLGGWEVRRLNFVGLVGAPLADSGTVGRCFQPAFVSFLECRMTVRPDLGETVMLQVFDRGLRARLEKLPSPARLRFAGRIYHVMELSDPHRVIVTLRDVTVAPP
jgi:hypothetical protein